MDGGEYERAGAADADGAEQAFAALRAEVAAQRRAVERIAALLAAPGRPEGPDYSPTLGAIAKELQTVTARLETLERKPALATPPEQQAMALRTQIQQAGEEARRGLAQSQDRLEGAVRELHGLIRSARDRQDQQQWLWTAGGLGVLLGVLLWFVLTAMLPWGAGDWLAALPLGGGPWQAGAGLMQRADPVTWERLVRLYQACPPDRATAACTAVLAARAAPPPDRRVPSQGFQAQTLEIFETFWIQGVGVIWIQGVGVMWRRRCPFVSLSRSR